MRHRPSRPLIFALAAAALLLLSACGPREIEPKILRYFTAEVVHRHDEFKIPYRLNLIVDPVVYVLFMGTLLGFKFNRRIKLACERATLRWGGRLGKSAVLTRVGAVLTKMWGDQTWGGALLFALVFQLLTLGLNAPVNFYLGWWYEHAHGTSVETLGHWFWDTFKGLATNGPILAAFAFGLYGLARRRRNWWLLLGVPSAIGTLVLGGLLDPLKQQIYLDQTRLADGPLKQAVVATLKRADVEFEDIYVEKRIDITRRANAYIMGDGPTRRIVLWDTLIKAMTPEEISNAVAHEVGHLRDRSPGRLFFASVLIIPLFWGIAVGLRRLGRRGRWGFEDDRDVASLPMIFFLYWIFSLTTDPLSNAYSRHLERRADQFAFELLQEPADFRSMMVKIARNNLADVHPPAYIRYFFASHPPVMERIEAAEAFAAAHHLAMPEPTPESFVLPEELDPLKQEDKLKAQRAAQGR